MTLLTKAERDPLVARNWNFFKGVPNNQAETVLSLFLEIIRDQKTFEELNKRSGAGLSMKTYTNLRGNDLQAFYASGILPKATAKDLNLNDHLVVNPQNMDFNPFFTENVLQQLTQPNVGFNPFNPFSMQNVLQQQIPSMPITSNQLKALQVSEDFNPASVLKDENSFEENDSQVSQNSHKIQKFIRSTEVAFKNGQSVRTRQIVRNLLAENFKIETIAKVRGLTEEQVKKLQNKQPEFKIESDF